MARSNRKANWLMGGILCILAGAANVTYFSQTGKTLFGPRSLGLNHSFDFVMSVLMVVFGVIALFIHFSKSLQ